LAKEHADFYTASRAVKSTRYTAVNRRLFTGGSKVSKDGAYEKKQLSKQVFD